MAEGSDALERLASDGEVELPSFTSEELVAVGANSPLPGLLISERLSDMGPIPLTAALGAALRGLVARGYIDPELVASELHAEGGAEEVDVPLEGDLALVVGLRRAPDFVGLVSAPTPGALAGLTLASSGKTAVIWHGLVEAGAPAVLEERRSPLGVHSFTLRTLPRAARALVAWLQEEAAGRRADASGVACELELALPQHGAGGAIGSLRHHWSVLVDPTGEKASLLAEPPAHDRVGCGAEELVDALALALAEALAADGASAPGLEEA